MSQIEKNSRKNAILAQLEHNALSFLQLQHLVGPENTKHARWILYDQLSKYKTFDELMALGAVCILLEIEKRNAPKVGHFILLLDHKTHLEHFDSYGLTMDEELKITQEKHLTRLFTTCRKKIVDNTVRLQQFREDINTCGRWVVARLLLRELELDEFISLIKYFVRPSDDLVAAMTLLLQYKR